MKLAKNTGIVSSFFTYTGSPWDEIDIEFQVKILQRYNSIIIQTVQGIMSTFIIQDLMLQQVTILMLLIGKKLILHGWQMARKYTEQLVICPSHPGKIMMNLWSATGVDSWLGAYNGVTPLKAYYDWVSCDQM